MYTDLNNYLTKKEWIKIIEFSKDSLVRFASNIVIKYTEANPNEYEQIRIKVKKIIDEIWGKWKK